MKKETSCINSFHIVNYVRENNNGDCSGLFGDLDPEIDNSPDPEGFLIDPNNWVSCSVMRKLMERTKQILQDDMALYKIGKYTNERVSLLYIQRILVKAFWSFKDALKQAQKLNDKWNRSKKIEQVMIRGNEAILRLHWDKSMDLSKDFCLLNQGVYAYLPLLWGGNPVELTEKGCFFEGAPYCEYHFKWLKRNRLHELFSRFYTSKSVLLDTLKEIEEDKKIIAQKYQEVNELNINLNRKVSQLRAIQETGKAILSILDQDELLADILQTISNVCHVNRAMVMLVNEKKNCIEFTQGIGFADSMLKDLRYYEVSLSRVNNILVRVANTGQSEYVPDVIKSSLRKENVILTSVKPTSVYVVPLKTRGKVIGVIVTDAVMGKEVPKETREVIEIFAPHIAIAIENARLYRALQEQLKKLERSHILLSRTEKISFMGSLTARLAHEIKNPMTAIGTFIQMLPYKYEDKEFRKNFYEIALEETDRVTNLISELLSIVKERETNLEPVILSDLVRRLILLLSVKSSVKEIEITSRLDPCIGEVMVDVEKIRQAILNILYNAVEHTPKKGKIEISTRIGEGRREDYIIEIKDTGEGISRDIIDKIFDPYFTTKYKGSMSKGTGLGLFIAHQCIKDHGGTINVRSNINEGSIFTLTLPRRHAGKGLKF
ncbi:MAG: GAF domain-containing protein [Deltaproteobacteria bacterium]|nr:GAF domain-containing protein [Deltaproteobacteria bacterium]